MYQYARLILDTKSITEGQFPNFTYSPHPQLKKWPWTKNVASNIKEGKVVKCKTLFNPTSSKRHFPFKNLSRYTLDGFHLIQISLGKRVVQCVFFCVCESFDIKFIGWLWTTWIPLHPSNHNQKLPGRLTQEDCIQYAFKFSPTAVSKKTTFVGYESSVQFQVMPVAFWLVVQPAGHRDRFELLVSRISSGLDSISSDQHSSEGSTLYSGANLSRCCDTSSRPSSFSFLIRAPVENAN